MTQAQAALAAFRQLLSGELYWQRGDRALTLQMLRGLAPSFFHHHGLGAETDQALDELDHLPASFEPELDLDQAMSRLDALHLRRVNGLPTKAFDPDELRAYIESAEIRHGWLPAWLMGEQAHAIGVDARRTLPTRFPFQSSNRLLHLYFITHLFMVDTDYFYHKVVPSRFAAEIRELLDAVPQLIEQRSWDLLAETEICLASCGQSSTNALTAIAAAQRADGGWKEEGQQARETAHTTAACLIALAAAESLEA